MYWIYQTSQKAYRVDILHRCLGSVLYRWTTNYIPRELCYLCARVCVNEAYYYARFLVLVGAIFDHWKCTYIPPPSVWVTGWRERRHERNWRKGLLFLSSLP